MIRILLSNRENLLVVNINAETCEVISAHDISITKLHRENMPDYGATLVREFGNIGYKAVFDEKICAKIDAILAS